MTSALPQALEWLVHRGFEALVGSGRLLVEERQHLRGIDACDLTSRIDPVIGIGETSPGHAAWRAAGRHLLRVDHETQTPLHAGDEVDFSGEPRANLLHSS